MVVTIFIMAHKHFGQSGLDVFDFAQVRGQGGHIFHKVQQGAGISVGNACQKLGQIIGHFYLKIRRAPARQLHKLCAPQGPQAEYMQARE